MPEAPISLGCSLFRRHYTLSHMQRQMEGRKVIISGGRTKSAPISLSDEETGGVIR
jgi:hypothetical protein